jgi:hypothetical protein
MIIEHEKNPSWSVPSVPRNAPDGPIDEVEALLRRYPRLSEDETGRVLDFLTNAPIRDRGTLSARSGMAAKMEQVRRDHARVFRPGWGTHFIIGVLIVAIVASGFLVAG